MKEGGAHNAIILQRGNCAPLPQRVVGCYTISNINDVISLATRQLSRDM